MKNILIIEDDAFLKDLESKKLASTGYKISTAGTMEELTKVLKEGNPDIILLDLMLPGVDGFEILKSLKASEATRPIPVLVFSNLTNDEEISRARELGAKEFYIKSNFTLDEIAQKIESIIGK